MAFESRTKKRLAQVLVVSAVVFASAGFSKALKAPPHKAYSSDAAANAVLERRANRVKPMRKGSALGIDSQANLGTAVKRSRNLRFDGTSLESVGPSKFDSLTNLTEGNDSGKRKLYGIPADFNKRAAEENREMGYRQ